MQLNIHFRRLQEMFLYVHNLHRGKTIREQYNRKICGVLRKYFFYGFTAIFFFFWYSNINNSNLYDAPRHPAQDRTDVHVYGARHFAQTIEPRQRTTLESTVVTSRVLSLRHSDETKQGVERRQKQRVENDRGSGRAATKQRAEARATEREAACRQQLSMTCVIVPRFFSFLFSLFSF